MNYYLFKKVFLRQVVTEFISSSMASFSNSRVCSGVPKIKSRKFGSAFGQVYRVTHANYNHLQVDLDFRR